MPRQSIVESDQWLPSTVQLALPKENCRVSELQESLNTDQTELAVVRSVKYLLSNGQIEEARKLASSLPGSSISARLKRLLAPPVVRSASDDSRPEIGSDFHWLRKKAIQFTGLWVALSNGRLLASAESLKALLDEAQSKHLTVTLYHRC